ncbi:MAG: CBS domain-containing protein [Desulfurococcales archaeon]|nr:CBS domain-containing protein [Desulfurococcales archaeon]
MTRDLFPGTRKKLVVELMDASPVTVHPRDPLTRARALFRSTRARVAYVLEERTGRLLGRITRADILAITSAKSNAIVETVMEDPPVILGPSDKVVDSVELMLKADEWYAPIVDNERLVGHIGLEHVVKSMVDEDPDTLENLSVEEVMTREDLETASADDFVMSIWEKMRELDYAGLPVVDEKGRLVGIVTQYDLLVAGARVNLESSSGAQKGPRVREVMTTSVVYLYPWSKVFEAAEIMIKKGFGRVPIVESESSRRLTGIVDREDIVRIMLGGD